MSGVKRFWNGDSRLHPECEMVLASDYDQLHTEVDRLKDQVKMLVNQYMPLTDKDCQEGWSRVIEAKEALTERDQLHTANQRLEGEVKRLRKALQAIRVENDHHLGYDAEIESIANSALSTANGEVTE